MNKICMAGAAAIALSLAACSGSSGNDMSGMATGSVHGGDYTASGKSDSGATAGQGDYNANTNGVNGSGGFSASSGQGYAGTGAGAGH